LLTGSIALFTPDLLHLGIIVLIVSMMAMLCYLLYGYRVVQVSTLVDAITMSMTFFITGGDG